MKKLVRKIAEEGTAGISVILPAYNAEKTIERAVESVLSQKIRRLELILIDDGPTDGTEARIKKYRKRIRYVRVPNRGVGAAQNLGIRLSRNDLIAFIDSDDEWLPGKLKDQMGLLRDRKEVALAATGVNDVDKSGKLKRVHFQERSRRLWRSLMDCGNIIPMSSVVLRNEILRSIREPFTTISWYAEDYYLWLRLSKTHDFYISPKVYLNYTVAEHPVSMAKYPLSAVEKCFREISALVARQGNPRDVEKIHSMMYFEKAILHARSGDGRAVLRECFAALRLSPWAGRNVERCTSIGRIYAKVLWRGWENLEISAKCSAPPWKRPPSILGMKFQFCFSLTLR